MRNVLRKGFIPMHTNVKKSITTVIAAVAAVLFTFPVFAGGHHHGQRIRQQATVSSYCPYSNCVETTLHYHNDTRYLGHCWNDGHDYHTLCTVENCTVTGLHTHDDGEHYCFAHTSNDGCANHTIATTTQVSSHRRGCCH